MVENILLHLDVPVYEFLQNWTINFHDLSQTDPRFYDHIVTTSGQKINTSMPSGVTGKYVIDLYLHDHDERNRNRENGDRVQHEICHAVLFGKPSFVKGVHDTTSRFKISFWYWARIWWSRWYMSVIDVRKFVKA